MSQTKKGETAHAIGEALRARQQPRGQADNRIADEIAALEASLLADIESFDIDAALRAAETPAAAVAAPAPANNFPEIVPASPIRRPQAASPGPVASAAPELQLDDSGLLGQLRRQAAQRQREEQDAQVERAANSEAIDKALKRCFFFLHDLVQQLNIVKPAIPRQFPLTEAQALNNLSWQEGFADYRSQSQSAGALVELVSFTCQLSGPGDLVVEREDGVAVERFRSQLFDCGLPFTVREFKNARHYVERAEFRIRPQLSVNVRWRADFDSGRVVIETRNFERLGNALLSIAPDRIDQALLDEFGRLLLAQPNRFRELLAGRGERFSQF